MSNIEIFQEEHPSLESYWRSVILFGRNVASYKFALAKSLLELMPTGKSSITLEELAVPFSKHLCEHISKSPRQATSNSSKFLDTCTGFNKGEIAYDELISTTTKLGFVNVIDAFHVVNNGAIPINFYQKDYNGTSKKIILTDNIYKLKDTLYYSDFMDETESRWNLVETAWELGISKNLLNVKYDDMNQLLFIDSEKIRRKDVTSARDALNGYQKGKCFYCFDDITVDQTQTHSCDVDHFFPHALQPMIKEINLNGVWNLVLSCKTCNRGENGKFAALPITKFLQRLHKRNEFLISSHHPLRETLMEQTGRTVEERISFLKWIDKLAVNILILRWDTSPVQEEVF